MSKFLEFILATAIGRLVLAAMFISSLWIYSLIEA